MLFGDVPLGLTGDIPVGAVPGVWLGARMSSRSPVTLVRRALAVITPASAMQLLGASTVLGANVTVGAILIGATMWAVARTRHGEAPFVLQQRRDRARRRAESSVPAPSWAMTRARPHSKRSRPTGSPRCGPR